MAECIATILVISITLISLMIAQTIELLKSNIANYEVIDTITFEMANRFTGNSTGIKKVMLLEDKSKHWRVCKGEIPSEVRSFFELWESNKITTDELMNAVLS